jgi:hypothetical protein
MAAMEMMMVVVVVVVWTVKLTWRPKSTLHPAVACRSTVVRLLFRVQLSLL